jgi:HD superfamily phosphodiesterase
LHDIADVSISRFSDNHEELSLNIAEGAMIEAGFSDSDRAIVLEDILPKHSCRGDMRPLTLEGKIVASADAIAHIDTDFYLFFAVNNFKNRDDFESLKAKLKAKLDRDFNSKLMFNDEKNFYRTKYENLKQLFS